MPALICGSLAFDTITNFPGRFAQQILPEQVHILNVSFLVPTLRREYGGCAGNIAYNLKLLGGEPVVLAAIGNDGRDYLSRWRPLATTGVTTWHALRAWASTTRRCASNPSTTPRRRSSLPTPTTTRSRRSTRVPWRSRT
jgi:sugar/nucleoside kinase (ribokinase family)